MALNVEDGTGLIEDANTYIDIEYADSYFLLRLNTDWSSATIEQRESAVVRGTDYIDTEYNFAGTRLLTTQSLKWPREGVYDSEDNQYVGIPNSLKKAVAEASVRSLAEDLFIDSGYSGVITRERVEGVVEIEYGNNGATQKPVYTIIDRLMLGNRLAISGSGSSGQLSVVRC